MQYKQTKKLFYGKYQYKVVLVCAGAGFFRSKNYDFALLKLSLVGTKSSVASTPSYTRYTGNDIKSQEDLDYALDLANLLKKLPEIELRVESPWISLYTNRKQDVDKIVKLNKNRIKYVSEPASNSILDTDTIILPKINFDFRVTIGKTVQNHTSFIEWADSSAKIKLTKNCRKQLTSNISWGGSYFYVKGYKNLLLSKVHLGSCITKIERIVKS